MKKISMIIIGVIIFSVSVYADKKAENVMAKAFESMTQIQNVEAIAVTEIKNEKNGSVKVEALEAKKVTVIKPYQKIIKKLDYTTKTELPGQDTAGADLIPAAQEQKYLYPKCLFGMQEYFENFDFALFDKDERIKQGKEEVIAIKKGQETEYPQIRITVNGNDVEMMKFFAMDGKKYYELIVDKTEKIKAINVPVEMTEKFYTNNGTMINVLKYENINF
ncbi:MAG: hypothetical protein CVV21_09490 [Candidatus Goldiibacteriota bacterium HGW-Goldbacteria-1]|jgi:hypothetical protein|nr:MAG: hypothetical protein CVV21_09490 [Candidatus Goldiibacteriota bacterium HGW-Goldbacteria-1]